MFFGKKRRMVDVRELQRRGVVHIPKEEVVIATDKEGFVDFNNSNKESIPQVKSSSNYFKFMNKPSLKANEAQDFSTEKDGYNKKEVDQKMVDLDNKVYKLEQRVELLERKVGVNQPSGNGLIGW